MTVKKQLGHMLLPKWKNTKAGKYSMRIKVGICGCYAEGVQDYGGQPVKTRIFIEEMSKYFGLDQIKSVDTFNWKRRFLKLFLECFNLTRMCENITILPAANGIKVFAPVFLIFNMLFKRKLHYVVIGGRLPNQLKKNKILYYCLKKFAGIYVETRVMEAELKQIGLNNVFYMPNFKRLEPVSLMPKAIPDSTYRFCTFSRVVKEKGVEDAIKAVIQINRDAASVRCKLDIYGHIYENYREEFDSLMADMPDYIVYKGLVPPDESVQILKDYFMQLFPTRYKTEGVPGSIIDSYFAGLPVLASKWESYCDVIDEGKTGIGYEFGVEKDLIEKMKWAIDNPDLIYRMKDECLRKAMEYASEYVIKEFVANLQ